ncbi:hypothetical protein ACFWA5_50840 [Streptomyces mirabilis]
MVRAVLPEMTERGVGAVLLSHGGTAVQPVPGVTAVINGTELAEFGRKLR